MKILSLEVVGLFGREDPLRLKFNQDMNIITGRNQRGQARINSGERRIVGL